MATLRNLALIACAALAQGVGHARAEMPIAIIAPWSTYLPYAALGTLRGTGLMVDALNSAGGLLGEKLRNLQIDDGCDPVQAEVAVKLAIASHPALVMGGSCSSAGLHVAQLLAAAKILQMIPNAPPQDITEAGIATILRITARPDREGQFAAAQIARRWPDRRIAVADDGDDNWHEAALAVAAGLEQRHIAPVLMKRFVRNQAEYGNFVRDLTNAHIDLVYLTGLPPDMGLIAREIAASAPAIQIVASRNGKVDTFRQTAGAAVEGIFFAERRDWMDRALADPVLAAEKARGGELNVFVISAYAAMTVWSQAVAAAGSFDASAVAATVKGRRFSTALGELAFDAKGDLTPESEDWAWYRWHDGRAETLE